MYTDKEIFNALVENGWSKISNHDFELKKIIKNKDFAAYQEYRKEVDRLKDMPEEYWQIEMDDE
jgi:hypothetical protein